MCLMSIFMSSGSPLRLPVFALPICMSHMPVPFIKLPSPVPILCLIMPCPIILTVPCSPGQCVSRPFVFSFRVSRLRPLVNVPFEASFFSHISDSVCIDKVGKDTGDPPSQVYIYIYIDIFWSNFLSAALGSMDSMCSMCRLWMMGFLPRITTPFSKMTMTIPPAESLQPVYTVPYCTVNSSPSSPLLINQLPTNPSHPTISLRLS